MSEKVTHLNVGAPWSVCTSRTMIEHLLRDVDRHRSQPLLFFEDGLVVGREEFLDLCERFAGYLQGRVRPGDRVGVAIGNRAEYFIALFAIVAHRGIVVSINPQSKEHDAGHVLADSAPVLLVVEPENHALFAELAKRTPSVREVICLDGAEPRGLLPGGAATPRFDLAQADCRRDDVTTVFYTSGTTGPPKGCMVDHEWWLRIVDVDLRMNPVGRERGFCSVPFFYADPAIYLMYALQIGGALVAMRRFSVSRYWDVVSRFGVTKVHAIASIPVLLVKATPHPLERKHTRAPRHLRGRARQSPPSARRPLRLPLARQLRRHRDRHDVPRALAGSRRDGGHRLDRRAEPRGGGPGRRRRSAGRARRASLARR